MVATEHNIIKLRQGQGQEQETQEQVVVVKDCVQMVTCAI